MILSGTEIKKQFIISPWNDRELHEPTNMTFGMGPAGYDIRMEMDKEGLIDKKILHPGECILVSSIECFSMPRNILGRVCDKSSLARKFLFVQNTIIEPNWSGFLTLELSYHGKHDLLLMRGMPIAQVVFEEIKGTVYPYNGKYQHQMRGPQDAI